MGLRKPSEGTVRVAGQLGFVPQLFQAAFSYSVIDMVLMGRARQIGLFGSPSAADYRVARDYLKRMGVEKLEQRTFNTLSGGQRQLVIIAQALCSECDILDARRALFVARLQEPVHRDAESAGASTSRWA